MKVTLVFLPFLLVFSRYSLPMSRIDHIKENYRGFCTLMGAFLKESSQKGFVNHIPVLLILGADINGTYGDLYGPRKTALYDATEGGHVDCVEALIARGADIHFQGEMQYPVLHEASANGYADIVKVLIRAGGEVNALRRGVTPLQLAFRGGHSECVRVLMREGADFTLPSLILLPSGSAATNNQIECIEALIRNSSWRALSEEKVHESRERVYTALLTFERLSNEVVNGKKPLENLKCSHVQVALLSYLGDDLAYIFLDTLKKGKKISGMTLLNAKDVTVDFLFNKLMLGTSKSMMLTLAQPMQDLLEEDNVKRLLHEALNERVKVLKNNDKTYEFSIWDMVTGFPNG